MGLSLTPTFVGTVVGLSVTPTSVGAGVVVSITTSVVGAAVGTPTSTSLVGDAESVTSISVGGEVPSTARGDEVGAPGVFNGGKGIPTKGVGAAAGFRDAV